MTVKAITAAFDLGFTHELPPVSRLILISLGDRADDSGYAFPGNAELVRKVGVDSRTIQRHLSSMEADGLVQRFYRKGGRSVPNLYRILSADLVDDPDAPGLSRYLEIFGSRLKGDNLSPLVQAGVTGDALKGDTRGRKGRHSSVTRSQRIQHETTEEDFAFEIAIPPRLPGESRRSHLRRINEP